LKLNAILDRLKIDRKYRPGVKRILRELVKDNFINKYKNTYVSKEVKQDNVITGKVDLKKDFGFLLVNDGEDVFLNKRTIENLLPGDEIEAYVKKSERGGKEGVLKRVIRRTQNPVICRIVKYGFYFAVPLNRESPFIGIKQDGEIKEGDVILIRVIETGGKLTGNIISKLYDTNNIEQYKEFILNKYEIERVFPAEVLKEADNIKNTDHKNTSERVDLRDEVVITIDPVDAKDFDDAVSLTRQDGGYRLGVHIADVSSYVKEGHPLDNEARKRSFSTYLPEEVYPMLPEKLSTDVCSLHENEDRLTFSIFISFDGNAEIKSYDIKETIIKNKKRFTYEEVEDVLENKKDIKDNSIKNVLFLMNELKEKLRKKFRQNGNVDFSLGEPAFKYDGNKKIIDIKRKEPLESHKIIEYFMISANICAADFILKNHKYGIFRVHPRPFNKDIMEFNAFLKILGINVKLKKGTNKEFQKILDIASKSEMRYLIEKNLLKAMPLAKYSEKNTGHFGLGIDKYTHFTSPIRRYADLLVHRMIKKLISRQQSDFPDKSRLKFFARNISDREEKTEKAENEIFRIYALDFLKKRMGDSFYATITKITKNGIVAELDEYPVEGFIDFDTMDDDYYVYDSGNMVTFGKRTGKIYRLGNRISVIIVRIDMDSQKMLLEIE
jgi:ribonuclease R